MKKRIIALLLCVSMIISLMPVPVHAADTVQAGAFTLSAESVLVNDVDYSYSAENGRLTILSSKRIYIENSDPAGVSGDSIYISGGVAADLTLRGVNIGTTAKDVSAVGIDGAAGTSLHLSLADGTRNRLYAGYAPAVGVSGGAGLTIDGNGYLDARTGYSFMPVIGASGSYSVQKDVSGIVINGGHIYLGNDSGTGSEYSAIGGGYNTNARNIYINGGEITVEGFANPVGGGVDPYMNPCISENIVVAETASLKCAGFTLAVPVGSGSPAERVYLYSDIEVPGNGGQTVIDGTVIPHSGHDDGVTAPENRLYVYLTAASESHPHEIVSGGTAEHVYYKDGAWTGAAGSYQNPISFEKNTVTVVLQDLAGEPVVNSLANSNDGAVTEYSCSNDSVAKADPQSGEVTVLSAGRAVITAVSKKDGFNDVSASYTLVVKERHDISIVPSADRGTVSADPAAAVEGETVSLKNAPADGYAFLYYSVRGTAGGNVNKVTGDSFVMPDEAVEITGVFSLPPAYIVVSQDPSGNGTAAAPESALPGETVTLTVLPEKGYDLVSFDVRDSSGADLLSGETGRRFVMPESASGSTVMIVPHFGKKVYTLETEAVENGGIEIADGLTGAHMGDEILLTVTTDYNYELTDLTVESIEEDDIEITDLGDGSFSFVMPASDVLIRAEILEKKYDITVSVADASDDSGQKHGTVTASALSARPGETVTVTAAADKDFRLSYISITPEIALEEKDGDRFTFEMPECEVRIDASFSPAEEQGTEYNPWLIGAETPDDIAAYIGGDGVLYIKKTGTGSGRMQDFATGKAPFYNKIQYIKEIAAGDGVVRVGDYAFCRASIFGRTTSITLPDSLTELGKGALSNCVRLTTLTIPANVQVIGESCFENDYELKTVIFEGRPDDLGKIADNAFEGVTADVYVPAEWLSGGFDPAEHQYGGNLNYIIRGTDSEYTVSAELSEYGRIRVTPQICHEGDTVTVYISGSEKDFGFYPDRLLIDPYVEHQESRSGDGLEVTFSMPDCDVRLSAVFAQPGTEEEPWLIGKEKSGDIKAWCEPDASDSSKKILHISPEVSGAEMTEFEEGKRPWEAVRNEITGVVVEKTDGSSLKNIGANAFSGMTEITDAELSDAVSADSRAFSGCTSLLRVNAEKLAAIGEEAFSGCTALAVVNTTDELKTIAKKAFYGCTSFVGNNSGEASPVLDLGTVESLGEEAFSGCIFLEKMTTTRGTDNAGTLSVIPAKAFRECTSLKEVSLGTSVNTLEAECFAYCYSLRRINIHGGCASIDPSAFKADSSYVYVTNAFILARQNDEKQPHLNDPRGTWFYGADILSYSAAHSKDGRHTIKIDQTKRGTVTLTETCAGPYDYIWMDIISSGSLWKGEIVEIRVNGTVVNGADIDLQQFTYIDQIPGYERTSRYLFKMPDGDLEFKINFEENTSEDQYLGIVPQLDPPQSEGGQPWNIGPDGNGKIQATLEDGTLLIEYKGPRGTSADMEEFKLLDPPWYSERASIRHIIIGEGVTSIGKAAFFACYNIESVSLPSSLQRIGRDAFYGSGLSQIDIPENVKEIGEDAFYRCSSLTDINFRGMPEQISDSAFRESAPVCHVTDAWLADGVTLEDLNDKEGNYQYGGNVEYVRASGEAHRITINTSAGGTVTASYETASEGTFVILNVTCDYGYELNRMTAEDAYLDSSRYSFVMPDKDVTITADFARVEYRVFDCFITGGYFRTEKQRYCAGEEVQIITETTDGWRLTGYEVSAEYKEEVVPVNENGVFIMPDYEVMLGGRVEKIPYRITVEQAENGIAFVNGRDGTEETENIGYAGDTLMLTAIPGPHKALKKWIIKANGETVDVFTDSYKMPACDIVAVPVFDTVYDLELLTSEGGRITCDAEQASENDVVKLNICPAPGYVFDGWEEKPDDVEISDDGSFTMPAHAAAIRGRFRKNSYAVTQLVEGHGTLNAASSALPGEKIKFTAAADVGHYVLRVCVYAADGTVLRTVNGTFTMPENDVTIEVEFAKEQHKVNLVNASASEEYGTAMLRDTVAGTGDTVYFTAEPSADCKAVFETSPWTEIVRDDETGVYSFIMPPVETDLLVEFYPVRGSKRYPWHVGQNDAGAVSAYIDDNGVLVVSGSGNDRIKDFAEGEAPWSDEAGSITGLVLEGLTGIGDNAFAGLERIGTVTVPGAVDYVGLNAFGGCGGLEKVIFEGKPEMIEPNAFDGVTASYMVGSEWLADGLDVSELNREDGDYQFGGTMFYSVMRGKAEMDLRILPDAEGGIHGKVSVSADYSAGAGKYYTYYGEKVLLLCSPDTGYKAQAEVYYVSSDGSRIPVGISDFLFDMPSENEDVRYTEVRICFVPETDEPTEDDPEMDDPEEDDPEKDDPAEEDPEKDDPKQDDPKKDDSKKDDSKKDDPKQDDPKKDDPEQGDLKKDKSKKDDSKGNDLKTDDPKKVDPKKDNPKAAEVKNSDPKAAGPKEENSAAAELKDNDQEYADTAGSETGSTGEDTGASDVPAGGGNRAAVWCVLLAVLAAAAGILYGKYRKKKK